MAHLYLSAAHKSSGKTTLAVGLAAALSARGLTVQPFKKGPDYIDPMWLSRAAGRPCYNLDYNTQGEDEIRATFARHVRGVDLALVEGNKGLHDGVDLEGRDSSAALAKLLRAPVLLVIDTSGITRGIAPLVLGYQAFDPEIVLAGVILNKVSGPRQESKLRRALERYTDVDVLGAVGRDKGLFVAERHLGLTTPSETGARDVKIDRLGTAIAGGCDLDRIMQVARDAPTPIASAPAPAPAARATVRIGVARDEAFGFYYPDDLDALQQAGAELCFFDTLADPTLPDVDGLLIGGGFPETRMAALEANASLRGEIRTAIGAGLPTYAECGGLMYLCRTISWNGDTAEMVGTVPADAVMHARPQGRGLVRLEETGAGPWPREPAQTETPARISAHEFHYARLENVPPGTVFAYRVLRGDGIDGRHDGIVIGNLLASFCHLRDTAADRWAARFVAFVRSCRAAQRTATRDGVRRRSG